MESTTLGPADPCVVVLLAPNATDEEQAAWVPTSRTC